MGRRRHHGRRRAVGRLDRAHRRAVLAAPPPQRPLGPGASSRPRALPAHRRPVGPGRALPRRAVVGSSTRCSSDDSRGERRDVALADTAAEDPWADVPRVNTLLIGSDAGKDRWGTRTDSMMVVSTNTKTGDTLLIGIPRNLERVPFPDEQPAAPAVPQRLRLRRRVPHERHLDPRRGPARPLPGRQEPRPPVDDRRRRRDHRPRHRPVRRHQPQAASGRSSTRWAGSTSTCKERVCVECHTATRRRHQVDLRDRRSGSSRACSTSTAGGPSGTPGRARAATTSAGCAASAASPVPSSSRPTPSRCCRRYPQLAKVVKNNVSIDIPRDELSAWVDLVLRIQKGGSIRSLPLTSNVDPPRATPTSPRSTPSSRSPSSRRRRPRRRPRRRRAAAARPRRAPRRPSPPRPPHRTTRLPSSSRRPAEATARLGTPTDAGGRDSRPGALPRRS